MRCRRVDVEVQTHLLPSSCQRFSSCRYQAIQLLRLSFSSYLIMLVEVVRVEEEVVVEEVAASVQMR